VEEPTAKIIRQFISRLSLLNIERNLKNLISNDSLQRYKFISHLLVRFV
jgi:hypothetical protein